MIEQKKTATLVKYKSNGELAVKITFPFNFDDVIRIKTILGRKFHDEGANNKYWTCPASAENIKTLLEWKFEIDDRLKEIVYHTEKSIVSIDSLSEINIPGLKGVLRHFQSVGVSFTESRNGRALIADEQGLGKTVEALAYLQLHPEIRPAVIVVPASLKLNWEKEAKSWLTSPRIQILSGEKPYSIHGNIIIINYDILHSWVDEIRKMKPKIMITDECHYYKSNASQRTKAVKRLAKGIKHFLALSGTPILNRPVEIYNAWKLIDPLNCPVFWEFAQRYCDAKHNGWGWDFNGASNPSELHTKLSSTIMIRRLKQDVLKELPDKEYSFVPIELDNKKEYKVAENDFIGYIQRTKGHAAAVKASNAEILSQIETLKQLAVQGSLNHSIGWITNFLESSDKKLVVFATHKFAINALMATFPDISVKIDGSVPNELRQVAVNEFQTNPKIRLFVGNIQAAGVGITLTAASDVVILELPWSPAVLDQAADRVHRIGQKNAVIIHCLLATNTIVEKIAHLLDHKRKVVNAVLDGKETDQESLLSEIMKEYL